MMKKTLITGLLLGASLPPTALNATERDWTFQPRALVGIADYELKSQSDFTISRANGDVLAEKGISAQLAAMEENAVQFRERAERDLLDMGEESLNGDHMHLFYPTEESEEFD